MNVTFHPENGTVSYFQRKFWRFDEKMSNGSLDDIIVQLNVVAIVSKKNYKFKFIIAGKKTENAN